MTRSGIAIRGTKLASNLVRSASDSARIKEASSLPAGCLTQQLGSTGRVCLGDLIQQLIHGLHRWPDPAVLGYIFVSRATLNCQSASGHEGSVRWHRQRRQLAHRTGARQRAGSRPALNADLCGARR